MYNFELLKTIKEKGLTQRLFAKITDEHESTISRIITGAWEPDEVRKAKFAKILRRKPEELFPG